VSSSGSPLAGAWWGPSPSCWFFIDDVAAVNVIVVAERCFKVCYGSHRGIVVFIVEGEIRLYKANGGGRDHLHHLDAAKHNFHLDVVGDGGVHVQRGTKVELRSVDGGARMANDQYSAIAVRMNGS
jgi:hypothetical protein